MYAGARTLYLILLSAALLAAASCDSSSDKTPIPSDAEQVDTPSADFDTDPDTDPATDSVSDTLSDNFSDTFTDPFLSMNALNAGVTVTNSGLQYEVLRASEGASPVESSVITVHYRGTLTDGTEFDSSYSRNQPSTFLLGGTIPGWVEGLQLMNVGSQFRLVLPPTLGYGQRGAPPSIPPDAVLIFEVELLEINAT